MTGAPCRIGIVGVGVRGSAIATRLLDRGHSVALRDPAPDRLAKFVARGAAVHDSAAALTRAVDIVVLSLNTAAIVEQAVFGPGGVREGADADKLLIDMSSIDPQATAPGLSASTIARLKQVWTDEHARWEKRDLSAKNYVYMWVDGIHVQARLEDDPQCLLVIVGATPEGKKELVGLTDGIRESAQSWRDLLLDLKRRGLTTGPKLAVADGALGFWQAVEEVWPNTHCQRCWVHKTANVLNKLPKKASNRRPSGRCTTSGWQKRKTMPTSHLTPSWRLMVSGTTRRLHV
jgi:hypothetical protein